MTDFVGTFDSCNLHFAPMSTTSDGRSSVELYKDPSMSKFSRLEFQLCEDAEAPMTTKYAIDNDDNPNRRGLAVKVEDPRVVAALESLDAAICAKAVECSAQWFKKSLNADQIEARYKPILQKRDGDDHFYMKIKVKTGTSKVPTVLHLRDPETGLVHKRGGRVEHLANAGAQVVPIVSAYSLWFMGGGSQFGISFQAERMIIAPGAPRNDLDKFLSSKQFKVAAATDEVPSYVPLEEDGMETKGEDEDITVEGLH